MNQDYYSQLSIKDGVNKVRIKPGLFKFIQAFEVLRLKNGQRMKFNSSDCEVGLVIFNGKCDINIDAKLYKALGARKDVFSGKPTAAYIPREKEFEVLSHGVEFGLCYAKCEKKTVFELITPDKVKVMQVGRDNWTREVTMIIGPDSPSVNLLVGETINPAGNWSGTPAHKHEIDNSSLESLHEELYYFKCDKKNGFGIERLYSPERKVNELIYIKEDSVTFMPWGYHQIVAGPGYALYYLFFLSGLGKNLVGFVDPQHKWINK